MALGLIEVYGFTTAVVVADAVAKAADVTIVALDSNKPSPEVLKTVKVPLVMVVKFEGNVAAVEQAAEAGVAAAKERKMFITSHIITRQESDTEKLAKRSALGRDKLNTKSK